ncbi:hypothetical protein DPV78_005925 [Talaromyces pinophilus]|nr:hypothetical protein DPV78_005925 [Talaromyces pinophilus]
MFRYIECKTLPMFMLSRKSSEIIDEKDLSGYSAPAPEWQSRRQQMKCLIALSFVRNQLHHNLTALILWMLHANLHRSTGPRKITGRRRVGMSIGSSAGEVAFLRDFVVYSSHIAAVIETDHVATWDDLSQTTVHRVADFDKVVVQQNQKLSV